MVSKAYQPEYGGPEYSRVAVLQLSGGQLVKETQNEGNGTDTLHQTSKEEQGTAKAQDIAELKDYVWNSVLHQPLHGAIL